MRMVIVIDRYRGLSIIGSLSRRALSQYTLPLQPLLR